MKNILEYWHSTYMVCIFTHVDDYQKLTGKKWGGKDCAAVISKIATRTG